MVFDLWNSPKKQLSFWMEPVCCGQEQKITQGSSVIARRRRRVPSPGEKVDSNLPNSLGKFEDGCGTAICYLREGVRTMRKSVDYRPHSTSVSGSYLARWQLLPGRSDRRLRLLSMTQNSLNFVYAGWESKPPTMGTVYSGTIWWENSAFFLLNSTFSCVRFMYLHYILCLKHIPWGRIKKPL